MGIAIKKIHWIDLSILGLTLVVMLMGIGSYGLYEPHEGHFAMVGQEMLWRNDWVTPHLNGSPYLNKPPLLYWLIAISTDIFGSNEFAARLPIALSGWLGIVTAWKWSRELWGIRASRITALMLSVTLGWFIFTHQILIDVLLGTLLLITNYCFWRSLYQPRPRLYWYSTYLFLALSVLTKGLIGAVFPIVGGLAIIIWRRDGRIVKKIKLYQGLLLVLAVILPWFVAIEQANPGFWHYFIVNEHFSRLLDQRFPPDYEVSKISAWGYLAVTAVWAFPWILFLPSVIKFTWQEWQRGLLNNASVLDRKNSEGILLLGIGTILPVILFLPLSSRLIYYSIPAIPSYIILCAGWWDKSSRQQRNLKSKPTIEYPLLTVKPKLASVAPTSTVCPTIFKEISCTVDNQRLNLYGVVAIIGGFVCYGAIAFLPILTRLLPSVLQTEEVARLTILVSLSLGTGGVITGIRMLKSSAFAWMPLFMALLITYLCTIRGFVLYQDIRSSKTIVQQADACLTDNTIWIFEGSRELGAAGGISYYLNQKHNAGSDYRTVKVLADGGSNRLPPQFPGATPEYLITQQKLQTYWASDSPVVFLTDFLRQPGNTQDPVTLNLPQPNIKAEIVQEQRRIYLNPTGKQIFLKQCASKNFNRD